jgi:hypothetical protein
VIYLSGAIQPIRHHRLGWMMTPDMGNRIPEEGPLGADNARFNNPARYSDDRYERFLLEMPLDRTLFAVAPDVVGNHAATLELSLPMLRRIREMGHQTAFVAQNGWNDGTTPWDLIDVIFVGGDDDFKYMGGVEAVRAARRRGKRAHMGRVNSLRRLRHALRIGCHTADGTFLKFGPDINSVRLLSWFDALDQQQEMIYV